MQYLNMSMVKGDTLCFGVKITGTDQLFGVWFSCKKNPDDTEYIFQKETGRGIDLVEPRVYRVRVAPRDTQNVESGTYYYDLQIKNHDDIYTILQGTLTINHEITKEW